jgi:hypothetical protein
LRRSGGMGELLLTLLRDRLAVDLVALAVVEVRGGQEASTTVSARALSVPDSMNGHERVIRLRIGGSVDKDGAAVVRLAGLVLW